MVDLSRPILNCQIINLHNFLYYAHIFIFHYTYSGYSTCSAGITSAAVSPVSAVAARIYNPFAITVDTVGNFYFAEYSRNVIRRVDKNGTMTVFAGLYDVAGFSGDGSAATMAVMGSRGDTVRNE